MLILGIISILSLIQSLFGVGLLLFGTPILLSLGLSYQEALLNLLPASMAISWSQVYDYRHEKLDGGYRKMFFLICIPLLVVGMMLTKSFNIKAQIKLFVSIMLIIAFMMREIPVVKIHLQTFMKKNLKFSLGIMGIVHGLSNMGGSILTPLVTSIYGSKQKILAAISFDYAFMATIQLIVLTSIQGEKFRPELLLGSLIALIVRFSIGKRAFKFTSENIYQKLISAFILVNAIMLLVI